MLAKSSDRGDASCPRGTGRGGSVRRKWSGKAQAERQTVSDPIALRMLRVR